MGAQPQFRLSSAWLGDGPPPKAADSHLSGLKRPFTSAIAPFEPTGRGLSNRALLGGVSRPMSVPPKCACPRPALLAAHVQLWFEFAIRSPAGLHTRPPAHSFPQASSKQKSFGYTRVGCSEDDVVDDVAKTPRLQDPRTACSYSGL